MVEAGLAALIARERERRRRLREEHPGLALLRARCGLPDDDEEEGAAWRS